MPCHDELPVRQNYFAMRGKHAQQCISTQPIIGGSQETGTPRAIEWFCKVSCPRKQNGNLLKLMPELLQDFLTKMKSKYIQTDWWFVLWIQVITGAFRWLICFQTIRAYLVLTLCINTLAAWMHGFKEGWASTMDRVVSVPKIDQQGWLRMCDVFSGAAPLATSHWNRSATH